LALRCCGANVSLGDLLIGRQVGGIGATSGLALILGGIYLMLQGELSAGKSRHCLHCRPVFMTPCFFHMANPEATPGRFSTCLPAIRTDRRLLSGHRTAASSPVNYIPMLDLRCHLAGFMTILIRNIGVYVDGVIFAILLINLINPLVDKIRPKAIGKVA
jgi:electron transport complex protein RnfD